MSGLFYVAWRYLAFHRTKTIVLVLSIALIAYVPVGLRRLVERTAGELTARADTTPLIVGARGSPLELVLSSLYFESRTPPVLPYSELERVLATGFARPIPLYVRHRSKSHVIVGTTLEYLDLRGLRVAQGGPMAVLGECLVGARVAEEEGLAPGDHVVSSPESVFDLAGVYPLRMRVAGVLAPSYTPDDDAIFVDVKTAWVIDGLGHGHDDVAKQAGAVLSTDETGVVANASVVQYNEITAENAELFHFHGDRSGFPLTAVVAVPHDEKASALLRGRYQSEDDPSQILRPSEVMDELLELIFAVQGYVVAALLLVACSTLATACLVFWLSLKLRAAEVVTMIRIGAARGSVVAVLALEIGFVLVAGAALAAGTTLVTERYGAELLRALVLS